ncbi:MAG: MEKHLA domain-containing protein [Sideroxydans sp.]|nr:MEKHLA domain-containing protein [Sideroxydans sp.]
MQNLPPSEASLDGRLRLIVESFQRLTGRPLIENAPEEINLLREAIWFAPRAIVAHGTEDDPVFFYGNRLALQLFEMSFVEFVQLPSRLSAEPLLREERAKLLEKVTRQGYVDGYSGMRIASSGRRFMIADGTVWNLADEQGRHHGQAAVFVAQQT